MEAFTHSTWDFSSLNDKMEIAMNFDLIGRSKLNFAGSLARFVKFHEQRMQILSFTKLNMAAASILKIRNRL
jgi:hypothetical protein